MVKSHSGFIHEQGRSWVEILRYFEGVVSDPTTPSTCMDFGQCRNDNVS
jgi:hypothetical protein